MTTSFRDSRDNLLSSLLDFLWSQWSALGVPGAKAAGDGRLIDPEALLLATTRFGRHDSRLLDGVLDWLNQNGTRINLQRLQRLQEMWPVGDMRVLGALASIVSRQSVMRKWAPLAKQVGDVVHEPLFIGADGKAVPVMLEPDPDFLHHGLLRDPVESRGMSKTPDPHRACNLLCTLRSLFGVNARAEIITWLLIHESGHPAAIARDTGYFSKSVQHTLNEMEDSGHISGRRDGREKIFWIRPDDWKFLITWRQPAAFPFWTQWMPLFSGIASIIDGFNDPALEGASPQIQAILLRKSMGSGIHAIYQTDFAGGLTVNDGLSGSILVDSFIADAGMLAHNLASMANSTPPLRRGDAAE